MRQRTVYRLKVIDPYHRGPFRIELEQTVPLLDPAFLYQDEVPVPRWLFLTLDFAEKTYQPRPANLEENDRGHWFYARSQMDRETLYVSPPVWVERARLPEKPSSGAVLVRFRGQGNEPVPDVAFAMDNGTETLSGVGGTLLRAAPGEWTLRAAAVNYEPIRQRVVVTAGQTTTVEITLRSTLPPVVQTGTLLVRFAPPGPTMRSLQLRSGKVFRSGREGQDIQLPAGRWTISSVFMTKPRVTMVEPGKRATVSIPLDFGYLTIAYPKDASPKSIFIDGKLWNGTNLLPPGNVTVELKDTRYGDQQTVQIVAGQTTTVKLERRRPGEDINGPVKSVTELPGIEQQPYVERETIVREGDPVEVKWNCEEKRSAEAIYELRDGEEFVGAKLDIQEVEGAKEQIPEEPVYQEKLRQVRGTVTFRGTREAQLPFADICPPGHARVRLLVTVRLRPVSKK